MFAAALMIFGFAAHASAQSKPGDDAVSFVGRWNGVKDWNGEVDTPYDGTAWWDLGADGAFIDSSGPRPAPAHRAATRLTFQYGAGGQTVFTGRLFGDTVLGTMRNSDSSYTGIFAMRQ